MTQNNQKYLLPVGFYDLLDEEAVINQESIDILLRKFYNHGYNMIKTPLVEFAALEFAENLTNSCNISEQSFQMIDIFSGKNLIIRSDITAQIARIINTRFHEKTLPMRLCYAGDVLKVKNEDLYSDRQLTQVGIELIGSQSLNADQEVIDLILEGLEDINLPNLIIDFCIPHFLDELLKELRIKEFDAIKSAIAVKNISQIRNLAGKYAQNLINLTLKINDFEVIESELQNLPIAKSSLDKISNLKKTVENTARNYANLKILINIFGDENFLYHQKIGFTIFEEGFSYPIARGGRYQIDLDNPRYSNSENSGQSKSIFAIGATIYINNLRKILIKSPKKIKKTILISNQISKKDLANLHSQGYITITHLEENETPKLMQLAAEKLGCNFIYTHNKIIPL